MLMLDSKVTVDSVLGARAAVSRIFSSNSIMTLESDRIRIMKLTSKGWAWGRPVEVTMGVSSEQYHVR